MRNIRAIVADSSMMFLEFKDKFIIYQSIYDKNTLKPIDIPKLFNSTTADTNYVGGWSSQGNRTLNQGLGSGWDYVFDGKGPLSLNADEGFSYNCRWHEKDHDPLFTIEDDIFTYQFVYNKHSSKGNTDLIKYSKDLSVCVLAENNWGKYIGIPLMHPDENLYNNESINYVTANSNNVYFSKISHRNNNNYKTETKYDSAIAKSINLLINKIDYSVVWAMTKYTDSCLYMWDKAINTIHKYKYNNVNYPNNTHDHLPINSTDANIGIHNNTVNFNNPGVFISDAIKISDNIDHYYLHYHYSIVDNTEAPYIIHYEDADGITQEADMTKGSNGNYGKYFGIWKMIVDHSKKEYYYEIITLNTDTYPDWNNWPLLNTNGTALNTTAEIYSFSVNSELRMSHNYNELWHNCEFVNINNTDYLLTFAIQSEHYGDKVILCAFTISNNTATLVGQPFIKLFRYDNTNGNISMKKIDRLGLNWILAYNDQSNTQMLHRIDWGESTGWEEYVITDKWNSNGMYIDELNRYWGIGFLNGLTGTLSVCTDSDFIVDYIIPPKINTNVVDSIISQNVKVQFRNVIGTKLKEREITVKILSNEKYIGNTVLSNNTTEDTITTDIDGIAEFLIISNGKDNYKIDYQLIKLTT